MTGGKPRGQEPLERRNFVIPTSLDQRFRRTVGRVYGAGGGNLSRAIREAMELWLKKYERQ